MKMMTADIKLVPFLTIITFIVHFYYKSEPALSVGKGKDKPDPEKLFTKVYDIEKNDFNLDKK